MSNLRSFLAEAGFTRDGLRRAAWICLLALAAYAGML
jgi:hypothetical protein